MKVSCSSSSFIRPFLVLYGADDKATPPAWNRAVQDAIPGAAGRCLQGAHLLNVEAADAYNAAVLELIAP